VRVSNLRAVASSNRQRVSATLEWEDSARDSKEVFFETTPEFSGDLTCDPHAFLLVSIVRAMRHGERRVAIEGDICPVLHDGLIAAMTLLNSWYAPGQALPIIEAKKRTGAGFGRQPSAAFMFSGGVDSLATLRLNRMNYPREHPWSIRDGLVIYGFDMGNQFADYAERYQENFTKQRQIFARRLLSLGEVAQDSDVNLIPVYTNTQSLCDDLDALVTRYHGADLAAVAYAFSQRVSIASISSSTSIDRLFPYGSHPMLDPQYSSAAMRIVHADPVFTRLQKTRLVADWDAALQNLRVCTGWKEDPQTSVLNCGKCEKCLRTMTALVVLVTGVIDSGVTGAALASAAFTKGLPGQGGLLVLMGLTLFSYTTMLTWNFYGEKSWEYAFGPKVVTPYRLLFIAFLFLGSIGGLATVWDVADTLNGLMAAPNLLALLLLAGVLVKEKVQYLKEERDAEAARKLADKQDPPAGS